MTRELEVAGEVGQLFNLRRKHGDFCHMLFAAAHAVMRLDKESAADPIQFSDPLVGATASQIFDELQKGSSCDNRFMEKLADVMLEQVYRVLTTPETGRLSPRHIHFSRLQKVLPYIRRHLADDLSVQSLADLVGLSSTHFRRLFQEALGVPVHRYVQAARLEQARMLLGTTTIPISEIAEESGFSSQSHMTACFRAAHAATPAEYRKQVYRTSSSSDRK
jgi:AraC family transcriptional regulator